MDPFKTLCQIGTVGNLSDGQILHRFLHEPHDPSESEAAFSALVDRHGPMVLRTVRQILRNSHDADDAFQATFLLLARKAGSVRESESVAAWLHGVALRIAVRLKMDSARRRAYEQRTAKQPATQETLLDQTDVWPELHEEIGKLPRHFREAVVLCYLEGLSTGAAAQRLGCPQGTILSRLARARERLRRRLTKRHQDEERFMGPLLQVGASEVSRQLGDAVLASVSQVIRGVGTGAATAGISASTITIVNKEMILMLAPKILVIAVLTTACAIGLGARWGFGESDQSRDTNEPASLVALQNSKKADGDSNRFSTPASKSTDSSQRADTAPEVLKATPADGNSDVDPKTKELRVTFDQDMNQKAMSVVGGGPMFPVDPSVRPKWIDARTIVIPLKLQPGRNYQLGINSSRFRNFQNTKGVTAEPYPIHFRTAGKSLEKGKNADPTTPPDVEKATPDDGDMSVDPKTKELRVTFDQDMNQRGMSVVGGGPMFPVDPSARPKWIDARTIVIPLKLEPRRNYQLGINSSRFRNFQNTQGIAAKPYPIHFKTGSASKQEK